MELLITFAVALLLGIYAGSKMRAKALAPLFDERDYTQAIDRANFLQTLRRELANVLIWRDPMRYVATYQSIHAEVTSFQSWRPDAIRQRHLELTKKYPNYDDFDLVATREYVLHLDGLSSASDEDNEERYKDIIRFEALSVIGDVGWKKASSYGRVHLTGDKELNHLKEYSQRVIDTQLRLRLERAMDDAAMRGGVRAGQDFENDFYSIKYVPHFAETRYGIHLKRTGVYGLYTFFIFDDGRTSQHYFRSDPSFESQIMLMVIWDVHRELSPKR